MTSPLSSLPRWQQALLTLAAVKVGVALVAALASLALDLSLLTSRLPVFAIYLVLFAGAAGMLLFGARDNRAATFLGAMFLLVAAGWSDAPIEGLARRESVNVLLVFSLIRVDAFQPYFLWLFAGAFPGGDLLGRWLRVHRWATKSALTIGAFLFVVNVGTLLGGLIPELSEGGPLAWARESATGVYWTALFLLDLGALAFLLSRSRKVRPAEKRRVGLFIGALAAGAAPMLILTVTEPILPVISTLWETRAGALALLLVIDLGLLSIPLTTAYAVLVHRVVDLRFVLRKAIQYSLARYTVLAATVVPFVLLVALLYRSRQQTLVSILGGQASLALVGLTFLGVVALRARTRWMGALDRRFFREQYDSARILTELAQRIRHSETPQTLWSPLRDEISRALHPVSMDLLLRNEEDTVFVSVSDGEIGLAVHGPLFALVAEDDAPFACELERFDSETSRLSENELDWLADGEYRLLVPIPGAGGDLLGVIALGPKGSELPYSAEDRQLLAGISTAVGLIVETRLSGPSDLTPTVGSTDPTVSMLQDRQRGWRPGSLVVQQRGLAAACAVCGRIGQATMVECASCGGDLEELNLPRVIRGKFLLERRIGRGGMGVVYRARDLDLDRSVAIKSLPRVSARYSGALRREARAMAAVTHPNLALIFGAESYKRLPLLVFEYLAGGTLASRIADQPLAERELLAIGVQLADVTDTIHRARILHRDIKPSNIGFSADDSPKLLDFGLARLVQAAGLERPEPAPEGPSAPPRKVAGTVMYLSPEAIGGRPPDYSFDLWSLSLSLYEALTGSNPFRGKTTRETLDRIASETAPSVRDSCPDCSPEIDSFFQRALAREPRDRPSSAAEMRTELKRAAMAGS